MSAAESSESASRARGSARSPLQEKSVTVPPVPLEHEELVVRRGRRSGLVMAVAVHSTVLGPALGGVRLWRYASPEDGIRDALRLARGMTYKAAAAGLDIGGGKGVICAPLEDAWRHNGTPGIDRIDVLRDFGDLVESLDGRYVTAEDVGISSQDVATIAERTHHAVGLPSELGGAGDPAPFTARGVLAAMRACVAATIGGSSLRGLEVVVVGAGHVGERLARLLAQAGAEVVISDVDGAKRALADELGAGWVEPADAMAVPCDVVAPCALGGAIDRENVGALRCRIVCGSANNVLADEALAVELDASGIVYAPDFVANAGGLISVYRELRRLSEEQVDVLVEGIGNAIERVLTTAEVDRITPLDAAYELARRRLASHRRARQPLAA